MKYLLVLLLAAFCGAVEAQQVPIEAVQRCVMAAQERLSAIPGNARVAACMPLGGCGNIVANCSADPMWFAKIPVCVPGYGGGCRLQW